MKFAYVVERKVELGFPKVYVPEYRDFRDVPLSHGILKDMRTAENVVRMRGGRVIQLIIEDAKGLPCCVRANDYPKGIIE